MSRQEVQLYDRGGTRGSYCIASCRDEIIYALLTVLDAAEAGWDIAVGN
jgi:hypothetical protein